MADVTVRVLRGSPGDDELAALVAVLSALGAAPRTAPPQPAPSRPRPVLFQAATSWRSPR
ncbi:acyl-CoA carboxylase subunit epsilon [Amycolatopsis sp. NPDC102389]|uniref:acyl-CoA carboxylase subunit epsilon n=1 Tax=Amycolatopsis sp. NPDC102389 TaxID=3363941 RepID=UPI00382F3DAE